MTYRRGDTWWGRTKGADGTVRRVSLKTRDKPTADRMQRMLDTLADQHRWAMLAAIADGSLPMREAFEAYNRNTIPALEAEIVQGTRSVDLRPFVAQWAAHMTNKRKPKAETASKYRTQVSRLITGERPFLAKDFTRQRLSAFLGSLEGVTQPNRYHAALSRFAGFLVEKGVLASNPLDTVERASESDPRVYELDHGEVARLLDALPEQDRPWHALMVATGAEWCAIRDAKVRDFDPDALTFRARGTKTKHRDRVVMVRKGQAVGILRGHYRRLNALPDAPLFPRLGGHRSALERFQRVVAALGFKKMRIHDWRHVFAVQAVRDGLPYHIIAHQLGHSNTVMLQRVYGRFDVTLRDLRGVEHSEITVPVTPATPKEA